MAKHTEDDSTGLFIRDITDAVPTKEDANNAGHVLYYSPSHGWFQGGWTSSYINDTTHWTTCPDRPPVQEDPASVLDKQFSAWVERHCPNVEPAAKALVRLGYDAAYWANRKVQ
jgi:hypothetical protein